MSACRSLASSDFHDNLRCDLCGKIFPYSPDSIGKLGQHSCDEHWLHKIGHYVCKSAKCEATHSSSQRKQNVGDRIQNIFRAPTQFRWISNAKVNVRKLKHGNFFDSYKTTIESWHDGPTELRCCACGYLGPPYIRKQKNKVASTRFGHYLLMACWPVFFAPMAAKYEITLYCKKCGSLFGYYDENNGCLIQSCCSSRVNCEVTN